MAVSLSPSAKQFLFLAALMAVFFTSPRWLSTLTPLDEFRYIGMGLGLLLTAVLVQHWYGDSPLLYRLRLAACGGIAGASVFGIAGSILLSV